MPANTTGDQAKRADGSRVPEEYLCRHGPEQRDLQGRVVKTSEIARLLFQKAGERLGTRLRQPDVIEMVLEVEHATGGRVKPLDVVAELVHVEERASDFAKSADARQNLSAAEGTLRAEIYRDPSVLKRSTHLEQEVEITTWNGRGRLRTRTEKTKVPVALVHYFDLRRRLRRAGDERQLGTKEKPDAPAAGDFPDVAEFAFVAWWDWIPFARSPATYRRRARSAADARDELGAFFYFNVIPRHHSSSADDVDSFRRALRRHCARSGIPSLLSLGTGPSGPRRRAKPRQS